jgi:DNA-binding CsgD family transcriptional regulator
LIDNNATEKLFDKMFELVAECESLGDICKRIVFQNWDFFTVDGVFIYKFNDLAKFELVAGHGSGARDSSAFALTTGFELLKDCLRRQNEYQVTIGAQSYLFAPFRSRGYTVGFVVLVRPAIVIPDPNLDCFVRVLVTCVGFALTLLTRQVRRMPSPDMVSEEVALSPRQLKILNLIYKQTTNNQIARELFVSVSTVKQEVQKIFDILSVNRRADAVWQALGLGILDSGDEKGNPLRH